MTKKVVITVGGTGGHVYPAMALAQQLKQRDPSIELLFLGGGLRTNRYFEQESFPFEEVSCGSFSAKKPYSFLTGSWRILKGIIQSQQAINSFKPDVVVGFGSYYTLPTLIAAKVKSIPIVLHEANRIPGKVNRILAPYVSLTGVHFPDTAFRLKGKALEIPIPLREGYQHGKMTQEDARKHFGLDAKKLTLLIFGGSQGAQAINKMASEAILKLFPTSLQILHFTGDAKMAEKLRREYSDKGFQATVKDYESRMDIAWQAADFMISRSGAGTIAEQLEFEVPGILIPYPQATDNHQESNADYVVDVIGGAIKCLESNTDPTILSQVINDLLANDHSLIKDMKASIQYYKAGNKSLDFCSVIQSILG